MVLTDDMKKKEALKLKKFMDGKYQEREEWYNWLLHLLTYESA